MIRKSGYRFSEQIMLHDEERAMRPENVQRSFGSHLRERRRISESLSRFSDYTIRKRQGKRDLG
jgi:hypothetical protein